MCPESAYTHAVPAIWELLTVFKWWTLHADANTFVQATNTRNKAPSYKVRVVFSKPKCAKEGKISSPSFTDCLLSPTSAS